MTFAQSSGASLPNYREADFHIRNFRFRDGGVLPDLRLHYITGGTPQRNAAGEITNAVLLLHGTTGRGSELLTPTFRDPLLNAGGPLDASRFFLVLPDNIGHGDSSRPSEGKKMAFPHYDYSDMVRAQHQLVTEGLGIRHLRLVGGISMGGMHTWMWGIRYPDMMDMLLPIACEPGRISGRNLLWRRIYIGTIESDPDWNHGNYRESPASYRYALAIFHMMDENPERLRSLLPDAGSVDQYIEGKLGDAHAAVDPNDSIYAFDASRDYDPGPLLELIQARLLAINFEDDELNPAVLGEVERSVAKVKHGAYRLVPRSAGTRGHMTLIEAALWSEAVRQFMQADAR